MAHEPQHIFYLIVYRKVFQVALRAPATPLILALKRMYTIINLHNNQNTSYWSIISNTEQKLHYWIIQDLVSGCPFILQGRTFPGN